MRDLLTYDPENFTKPRYVQRLSPPEDRDSPFAFGASRASGGLPQTAMDLLRPVWSFEYMGAAEFEAGASGFALVRISEGLRDGAYESWQFFPKLGVSKRYELEKPTAPIPVWVIGRTTHRTEIEAAITEWANKPGIEYDQLKECAHVARSLRPRKDATPRETQGWLELSNGFLFFRDQTMFERALLVLTLPKKKRIRRKAKK